MTGDYSVIRYEKAGKGKNCPHFTKNIPGWVIGPGSGCWYWGFSAYLISVPFLVDLSP